MSTASLTAIVRHCDQLLRTAATQDFDRAHNGLQVENDGRVTRIAATVDASLATVRMAIAAKADLLIVHHGLFWSPTIPWTGPRRELMREVIQNNLAIYSSHLPLDSHPRLGNAVLLARALGLKNLKPFFFDKGQHLGVQTKTKITRTELAQRLQKTLGHTPTILPGGANLCQKIGIVTGGAGADLHMAAGEGADTFITGEGPHWTYALAEELGMNVFYGGHYATETFGVKALAAELSRRYKIPWLFLDHPTGL